MIDWSLSNPAALLRMNLFTQTLNILTFTRSEVEAPRQACTSTPTSPSPSRSESRPPSIRRVATAARFSAVR